MVGLPEEKYRTYYFSRKFSFSISLIMVLQEISILRELSDISSPHYMIDIFTLTPCSLAHD
jgi:hypothetical protein